MNFIKGKEDSVIMYLIIRKSLNMSPGKLAAQCSHATQMLMFKYMEFKIQSMNASNNCLPPFSREKYNLFQEWFDGAFTKVVLKADEKQWKKLKEEFSERDRVLVVDAGLTELEPKTETCIGFLPIKKSDCPKLISRLRLL